MRMDAGSKSRSTDADIDFTRRSGRALPAGARSAGVGTLTVPVAGDYDIDLQSSARPASSASMESTSVRMGWWGGHGDVVFPNRDNVIPTTDGLDNLRRLVKLSAGPHAFTVEAKADGSGDPVQVRLAWVTPEMKAARVRGCHLPQRVLQRSP